MKYTDDRLDAPLKALRPITATVLGSVIVVRLVAPSNIQPAMVVRVLSGPNVTLAKLLALSNASLPMLVTLPGMAMLSSPELYFQLFLVFLVYPVSLVFLSFQISLVFLVFLVCLVFPVFH